MSLDFIDLVTNVMYGNVIFWKPFSTNRILCSCWKPLHFLYFIQMHFNKTCSHINEIPLLIYLGIVFCGFFGIYYALLLLHLRMTEKPLFPISELLFCCFFSSFLSNFWRLTNKSHSINHYFWRFRVLNCNASNRMQILLIWTDKLVCEGWNGIFRAK